MLFSAHANRSGADARFRWFVITDVLSVIRTADHCSVWLTYSTCCANKRLAFLPFIPATSCSKLGAVACGKSNAERSGRGRAPWHRHSGAASSSPPPPWRRPAAPLVRTIARATAVASTALASAISAGPILTAPSRRVYARARVGACATLAPVTASPAGVVRRASRSSTSAATACGRWRSAIATATRGGEASIVRSARAPMIAMGEASAWRASASATGASAARTARVKHARDQSVVSALASASAPTPPAIARRTPRGWAASCGPARATAASVGSACPARVAASARRAGAARRATSRSARTTAPGMALAMVRRPPARRRAAPAWSSQPPTRPARALLSPWGEGFPRIRTLRHTPFHPVTPHSTLPRRLLLAQPPPLPSCQPPPSLPRPPLPATPTPTP